MSDYPLIPGNEIVGVGVNVVGSVYSTADIPIGGQVNRIYNLKSNGGGSDWQFPTTGTWYAIPPGLSTPTGGNTEITCTVASSRRDFASSFSLSADVSGSYMAFSAQLDATYSQSYQNSQENSYVYVLQNGLTWSVSLDDSEASLVDDFVKIVGALPAIFDKNDVGNAMAYYDLFENWGTHYVSQAHVGGKLYYYASVDRSSGYSSDQIKASFKAEYDGLLASAQASANAEWNQTASDWTENRESFIVSVGPGTQEIPVQSFLSPPFETWLGPDIITAWQSAVDQGPGTVSVTLREITSAIERADDAAVSSRVDQVKAALNVYGKTNVHVSTPTAHKTGAGLSVFVTVDGASVQFSNQPSSTGYCGLVAVILDRSSLTTCLAKFYEAPTDNSDHILNWQFLADFRTDVRAATDANPSFLIVIATYGLDGDQICPAYGDQAFGEFMQSWGGGEGLDTWLQIGPSGWISAPTGDNPCFAYVLIGANDMGYGEAVEAYFAGGVRSDQTYDAVADAQLKPQPNQAGTAMIFTPVQC